MTSLADEYKGGLPVIYGRRFVALKNKYITVNPETNRERATEPTTTLARSDGPYEYIASLDCEVPTYINPRNDLVPPAVVNGKGTKLPKTLTYHVPFCYRGAYRVEDLTDEYRESVKDKIIVDDDGFVMCTGQSRAVQRKPEMRACKGMAHNRSLFCRRHGGALHPADKKITVHRDVKPDPDKERLLNRVEKVMMGIIPLSDLSDEEITNGYVLDDEGKPVVTAKLNEIIQQKITKELFRRMNQLMQSSLPSMIETMTKIAASDVVEPADRIKAAEFVINRVMGKAPDVVLHSVTDKPFEMVFDAIDGGSRDAFRNARAIESKRMDEPDRISDLVDRHMDRPLDAEVEEELEDVLNEDDLLEDLTDEEKAQYEEYKKEREKFLEENYVSTPLGNNSSESSGDSDAELQVDKEPAYSYANRMAAEQKRIEEEKKAAAERIKKSRNKRYAQRASGVGLDGALPWLIEFGALKEISMGRGKPKRMARHAKIWLPNEQTPAVVDRIKRKNLERQIERDSRLRNERENNG